MSLMRSSFAAFQRATRYVLTKTRQPTTLRPSKSFSTCSIGLSLSSLSHSVPFGVRQSEQEFIQSRNKGIAYMMENGYDMESAVEQQVVWGDHDQMGHLNNVRYLRYVETARMQFIENLARNLSPARQKDIQGGGTGVGVILASTYIKYKRPVVYPDTLLVASKPSNILQDRFNLDAVLWSYSQLKPVATVEAVIVSYDYGKLAKASMPDDLLSQLKLKMQ